MANLTPLFTSLAGASARYRRGQLLREQLDADEADRAARRARETRQLDLQSQALRVRLAEREAEREAERAEFTARVQALVDAGVPPERAKAGALFPGLADNFLPQPAAEPVLREKIRQRIEDLMQQGRTLDQANSQARREFGYTVPGAAAARAASPITDARRNLPIYERGVREAQSAVTAAQRAMPERPAFGFLTPSDSTRFVRDSTAAQADVEVARAALREARAARDSVAAEVTGAPPAASVDDAATLDRMQTEMRNAFLRRQRLLDRGVDPDEVDRAYRATVQLILRRYGQS